MAKVDKIENPDSVTEKKVEKKLKSIFLMELLMFNQLLIIL